MKNLLKEINLLGYKTDFEENSGKEFSIYSKDNDDLLINVYENTYTIQDENTEIELINLLNKFRGDVNVKKEVGISLKVLYEEGMTELIYGGRIIKNDVEEENYELIIDNDVASYDGEVNTIIEKNNEYVILRNEQGEYDKEFKLSIEEFGTATFN